MKAIRLYLRFEDGEDLLSMLRGRASGNIMRLHYLDKQLTRKEMLGGHTAEAQPSAKRGG
ncbi:MAG: hypothetical protein QXX81_07705 [Zestosphaera sp.]